MLSEIYEKIIVKTFGKELTGNRYVFNGSLYEF